ncbi:MAG: DUF1559 domain-containing protein [Mariniblastus sp.]
MRIRKTNNRRSGFTLVELLVVIAIIGILIAMALPAVQSVRESARVTECSNNIRQIALSLQSYNTAHRHFPAGWNSRTGWGWMTHSLPFIEQQNLFDELNLSNKLIDVTHSEMIKHKIPGQLCPSSTNNSGDFELAASPSEKIYDIGRTHYVASIGSSASTDEMEDGQSCPSLNLLDSEGFIDGVFYKDSKTPLRDILDGTSNTILVGERSGSLFDSQWPGILDGSAYTGWRVVGWSGEPPNNPMRTEPLVVVDENGEESELEIHFHGFAQYNSMHNGITLFAFCDGSTRSISDNISPITFHAMGTIRGRETLRE